MATSVIGKQDYYMSYIISVNSMHNVHVSCFMIPHLCFFCLAFIHKFKSTNKKSTSKSQMTDDLKSQCLKNDLCTLIV